MAFDATSSSSSDSTKTMSFRSYASSFSPTTSSLSHENSANDVVYRAEVSTIKNCFSSQCIATLQSSTGQMISCIAAHGNLLYAASGGRIDVYDLPTFSLVDTFNGGDDQSPSSGMVKAITFDSENNKVFTAHQDCKIRVWKLNTSKRHRLASTLPTFTDRLCRFANPKNYVHVRRHVRRLWIEHNDAVSGLAVHDGLLHSVSWDRGLKVWRTSDAKCVASVPRAHDDAINAVAVSAAGDGAVYTASADGKIKVWGREGEAGGYDVVAVLKREGTCAVNALAVARDGMSLMSGSCEGEVVAWGRERGEGSDRMRVRAVLLGHEGAVLCMAAVDHRGMFASGSADRTVRIWGVCGEVYCCLGVLEGHRRPVRSLAAVVEEEESGVMRVVSGSLDGVIKIWEVMCMA